MPTALCAIRARDRQDVQGLSPATGVTHCCPVPTRARGLTITTPSRSAKANAPSSAAPDPTDVLSAVAEPNRMRLLRVLLDGEHCVTQCVELTGLPQSLASKHLRRLIDAGLVQRRASGRRNYHSVVDPQGLRVLLDAASRLAGSQPLR